ncbi:DUF2383 domain-containing protein [Nitrosococcus watsonii]|nr:DUF2383 domain-containing protein [Nitrosococcus watsonii]
MLDEIVLTCTHLERDYLSLLKLTEEPMLTHLFTELANQHGDWAEQLESHIREMGELPSELDPERQAVEELITYAKAALSSHERHTILKNQKEKEEKLKLLARGLLKQKTPDSTQFLLRYIEKGVEKNQSRLLAARFRS